MVKTRSQTRNIAIKKEEKDCKPALVLSSLRNTRSSSRIAKRRLSKSNSRRLPVQQVKVEEDTDTKSLLKATRKSSNLPKGQQISQEQINQLFDYILNENMSVTKASRMAKLSQFTGSKYYNDYKNDPEKKIPSVRRRYIYTYRIFTQEHVENLIRYIINGKMSIKDASKKINMCSTTARRYYYQYLKDNNMEVPAPRVIRPCTQEDKNELIRLIFEEKMSIKAAAKKAPMYYAAALQHYHQYVEDHNLDLVSPKYTQYQLNQLISYIIDDKMNIKAASRKVNMSDGTGKKYYLQYLNDNHLDLPVIRYTQAQKSELIGYIIDDKMSIKAATKKANINSSTGRKIYRKYLMDHNIDIPVPKTITQDQIDEFISYIVDDKITAKTASKKANMSAVSGSKHYWQYLKEHNRDVPIRKRFTQDEINEFIGYVVRDKMSVKAASRKANMASGTGHKYYHQYLSNRECGSRT